MPFLEVVHVSPLPVWTVTGDCSTVLLCKESLLQLTWYAYV